MAAGKNGVTAVAVTTHERAFVPSLRRPGDAGRKQKSTLRMLPRRKGPQFDGVQSKRERMQEEKKGEIKAGREFRTGQLRFYELAGSGALSRAQIDARLDRMLQHLIFFLCLSRAQLCFQLRNTRARAPLIIRRFDFRMGSRRKCRNR